MLMLMIMTMITIMISFLIWSQVSATDGDGLVACRVRRSLDGRQHGQMRVSSRRSIARLNLFYLFLRRPCTTLDNGRFAVADLRRAEGSNYKMESHEIWF